MIRCVLLICVLGLATARLRLKERGGSGERSSRRSSMRPTTIDPELLEPLELEEVFDLAHDIYFFADDISDYFKDLLKTKDDLEDSEGDLIIMSDKIHGVLYDLATWGNATHNDLGERWIRQMRRLMLNGIEEGGQCQKVLEFLFSQAEAHAIKYNILRHRRGAQGLDPVTLEFWNDVMDAAGEEIECIYERFQHFLDLLDRASQKLDNAFDKRNIRETRSVDDLQTKMRELVEKIEKMSALSKKEETKAVKRDRCESASSFFGPEPSKAFLTEIYMGQIFFGYMHLYRNVKMFGEVMYVLLGELWMDIEEAYATPTKPSVTSTSVAQPTGTTNLSPRTTSLRELAQKTRKLEEKLESAEVMRRLEQHFRN